MMEDAAILIDARSEKVADERQPPTGAASRATM